MKQLTILVLSLILFSNVSCNTAEKQDVEQNKIKSDSLFIATMQKHLDAVSNKDLLTLKSTLSPNGNMQLILPKTEVTNTVEDFMAYHEEWFDIETPWTFETKILNTEIGNNYGIAITQIIYREPERDGKPYFNRMSVSYALQKINDHWYIIKDHASSIEKSTD